MARHWSGHQLTEYLAALGPLQSETDAVAIALERMIEPLDSEVGIVVVDDQVVSCLGVEPDEVAAVCTAGSARACEIALPGLGDLHLLSAQLGREVAGMAIVARTCGAFEAEERQMLEGMARVLGLTVQRLRTLANERELRARFEEQAAHRLRLVQTLQVRESLLSALLEIQRAISNRVPLQEVLDTITSGAAGLLNAREVALGRRDPTDPDNHVQLSRFVHEERLGCDWDLSDTVRAALSADDAATLDSPRGDEVAIAVPVHVSGDIDGYLLAAVPAGEHSLDEQRNLLVAFAQQVTLALADARAVEAMHAAFHDSLTGLPNRAQFLERLELELPRSQASSRDLSVLFIDLDGFKAVNDTLGHAAGDELLSVIGGRLRECVRSSSLVSRLGGDEFAVMLDDVDEQLAHQIAYRIIGALERPVVLGGRNVCVSASVGITSTRSTPGDATQVLGNADVAMYRAKKQGRGRIVRFEPQMHEQVARDLQLRSDLQGALSRGELWVQYQPIIELETGLPVALEALMRWTHPQEGAIAPDLFIALAEETGVVLELGAWVLREAVRQLVGWRRLVPSLGINVNVSPFQLQQGGFVEEVRATLADFALPPAAVTLEITESVLVADRGALAPTLRQLCGLGVRIAIDDFGIGHSSLSHLRQLPVHQLKIDRSFVNDLAQSDEAEAVFDLVLQLSNKLALEAVAEGVEDSHQLEVLQTMGCNLAQGYHFARPLSEEMIPQFLTPTRDVRRRHPAADAQPDLHQHGNSGPRIAPTPTY
jgi:diguanylate cyclase (GGDEF)-like protein